MVKVHTICILALLYATSFIVLSCKPMESPNASGMIKINSWQDVTQFAGKIVVFIMNNADTPEASCSDSCNQEDVQLKYGHISAGYLLMDTTSRGYFLQQIVAIGTQGFSGTLSHSLIEKGLILRCATERELIVLHHNIHSKKDEFLGLTKQANGLKLLERQSGFEMQKRKLL